jgi:hypothetical protein
MGTHPGGVDFWHKGLPLFFEERFLFAEILSLCYKAPEWLSIATTKTLQALLNRKSKGCLKKHSLSLESQRSPRATHNPKVAGSSPAPAIKLIAKSGLEPTTHGS